MKPRSSTIFHDVIGLFLPRRCSGCDGPLMTEEESLCLRCEHELPLTRFHNDPDNPVERLFHGKLRLEAASSLLKFTSGGMVQHLLHRLKYKGDRAVGLDLGRRMAQAAMASPRFADVQLALPVPLHPHKQRQRGYNQCDVLVEGMREEWPALGTSHDLLRLERTATQTRRGRLDRWHNVREAFGVGTKDELKDRHVLIIDDVVTTGATLEGCARALAEVPGVRISVFTCACA